MQEIVDTLEQRVASAVALIAALREKTAALDRQLTGAHAGASADAPAQACDPEMLAELERLRAERVVVRERIRSLIREIDRVSW